MEAPTPERETHEHAVLTSRSRHRLSHHHRPSTIRAQVCGQPRDRDGRYHRRDAGLSGALSTKSRVDFEKHCVRAGGMSLSPPAPTALRFCTIGSFIEYVTTLTDEIDERIWDPEVKVHDVGNLATVWAPFRAKINGVVDHVGAKLFVLHKMNGEWKVTGLADSCRRPTEEEMQMK